MNSETKLYEAQMMQQLIKNTETIAMTQKQVSDIKTEMSSLNTKMSDIETKMLNIEIEMSDIKQEVSDIKQEISEIKTELTEVTIKADRADSSEWWFRFIAGAIILSFFKEQLMSFF